MVARDVQENVKGEFRFRFISKRGIADDMRAHIFFTQRKRLYDKVMGI